MLRLVYFSFQLLLLVFAQTRNVSAIDPAGESTLKL